ncbi:MAG: diadenylate cyclase CdaA [Gemmatales bacterium]|nr:diadenylate cyclase CdaA [Gemmatales bacterium]MDW7995571.1 diadenylate cyclase CdaA [Gemmatales bacterium]
MERLRDLFDGLGWRDVVEILLLALILYAVLRFLGNRRGAGLVRGLAIVVAGTLLLFQVIIISFDLTELSRFVDYLLSIALLAMIIIFQPELRRGLFLLGQYRLVQLFVPRSVPIAERLAEAALALSREYTGALIAIEQNMSLDNYIQTGERLDAEVSPKLLRAIFHKRSPLHDGAVIIAEGRIAAAGCQLPLADAPTEGHFGMRHRAALGLSEETDAIVLVVSEETGRISLAIGGRLETLAKEHLTLRLSSVLPGTMPLAA